MTGRLFDIAFRALENDQCFADHQDKQRHPAQQEDAETQQYDIHRRLNERMNHANGNKSQSPVNRHGVNMTGHGNGQAHRIKQRRLLK